MILSKLDEALTNKFGNDWYKLEVETLSLELGAMFDELTIAKIAVLKALEEHPDIILHDADYFLRFIEVANSNTIDPHHHDIPSSLELIYALQELWAILGKDNVPKTSMLREVTKYVLDNEGHGEAYHSCLSMYSGRPFVKNDKTSAGDLYIKAMNKSKGDA